MSDACAEHVLMMAENIRQAVEALKLENQFSSVIPFITVSIGISVVIPNEASNLQDYIKRADKALYQAKRRGRNQVVVFDESGSN